MKPTFWGDTTLIFFHLVKTPWRKKNNSSSDRFPLKPTGGNKTSSFQPTEVLARGLAKRRQASRQQALLLCLMRVPQPGQSDSLASSLLELATCMGWFLVSHENIRVLVTGVNRNAFSGVPKGNTCSV